MTIGSWACIRRAGLLALFLPLGALGQFTPPPFNYAAYATASNCGAITMSGGAYTDSFDSSQGSYQQTKQNTNGNVGITGNINLSGSKTTVKGTISALNINVGSCVNGTPGITLSGGARATGGYVQLSAPPSLPSPPPVTPGSKDYSYSKSASLGPGSYHNITVSGGATLTLSAGTYNVNSIVLSGGSTLTFSGTGQVIINAAGNRVSQPFNFSGGSISNPSGIALNFQLIYGGTLSSTLSGGAMSYAVAYLPNAPVTLSGGQAWYGAMVVSTLNDSGGSALHFDRSLPVTPVLLSANPNSGQQGQQNLSVVLTGQFTNWVQGTTTASLGAGVTVASLTVTSPTSATAIVNIDPTAATGARTVTMTTGSEVETLTSGFTVNPGTPVLLSVNPNAGLQGQLSEAVSVTGEFTHFGQGTTAASFGLGITIVSVTVNSSTSATVVLNISSSAATGARTVTLTTGTEVATLNNGFTVTAGTPVLLSVNPNSGQQGQQNVSVTLTGQFTSWVQGTTTANFGAGITVASLTVSSSTGATAVLNISASATTGARTVTLTTGSEVDTLTNGFTVTAGTPVLVSANPNSGQQGQQNLSVALTGQFTNWVQGTTTASLGAGVTVASLTVTSSTSATAVLNISASATTGARTVTLTTGSEVDTLTNGFTVTAGTPVLVSANPNSGQQGQQNLSVALTGQFTNWVQGTTTASFGTGITVASLTVTSSTSATAVLNITASATTGARTVTLTTGSEVDTLTNGFTVTAGTPVLVSVSPNSGQQGQQNLSVALTGQFTHWVQGTTTASFGTGITVASLTVTSSTSATAVLNISASATTGTQTVTVTTGAEVVSLSGGFLITQVDQPPTVTAGPIEYPVPSAVEPEPITAGPDGNLWFTDDVGIWRITTAGVTTEFLRSDGSSTGGAYGITPGPDGNLWFTEYFSNKIGKITTAGAITEFEIPNGDSRPFGIAAGPDGNLWFVERYGNAIGRITPAGVITEFAIPTAGSAPIGITTGPDGNLWFTEGGVGELGTGPAQIGKITTAGAITEFPLASSLSEPTDIIAGPDGNLWFTEATNNIGRITTAGAVTEFSVLTSNSNPFGITVGPDGNLWFAEARGPNIGRITTGGAITEFSIPTANPFLYGIVTGPDGNVWFVELAGRKIGKANPGVFSSPATATLTGSVTDDGLPPSATLTATWSATGAAGSVSFGTPTMTFPDVAGQVNPVVTSATFSALGTYTLTLTGSDSQLQSSSPQVITINPSPVPNLLSVNPNAGQQGQQNLSVVLTGQSTNWVQGTTTASFGAGVTLASLSVTSSTSATAVLNISASAAAGVRTVTLTTGSEVETLTNGFTVTTGTPVLLSVNPNTGQQGQQTLSVAITGQNTNWVQGTTTATFGAGITVVSLTVNSSTSATAVLDISSTAPTGASPVTLTTGSEVDTLTNGFTVTAATPIITSLVPASGQQGQTLPITVTGQNTHFAQGTTQVSLGTGITVTSVTVSSATSLTAQLTIDSNAALGTRTLTVTTGTEVASVPNVFTVTAPATYLYSVSPGGAQQGQQNLPVTITGVSTHFVQGTSQVSFGNSGITVSSVVVASATSLTANINVAANAPTGPSTVTVTTGSEVASFVNGFTVTAGSPILLTINPGGAQQGQQNLSVALTGAFTNWTQGVTTASFGAGITVVSLTVSSPTSATAVINISSTAATGGRTVSLTTGTEVDSFVNGFTVTAGTAQILTVNPGGGQQGQQNLSVAITGQFTNWTQGTTTANFGAGITVASLTVTSPTSLTAVVNISATAATGNRTVSLTTGSEVEMFVNGFTVTAGTPVLLSVSPNSGQQGQQNLSVTITGEFTNWVQGTTTADFGEGITVASVTVNSSTSATAILNISATAGTGARTVTLTTGTEVDTLGSGFTVTTGAPVLVSVNPNSGQQGAQNLSITITGQNTHFAQGTSQVTFGTGITVASVTVASTTSLTANINIAASAPAGSSPVTVTTGSEVASLNNGFTVTTSTPVIVLVNPNGGQQGQTNIPVAVTGQNTHFAQGTSQVSFGTGVTVDSVSVDSATSLTAEISIAANATTGSRALTVTTGSEVVTLTNAFTVLAASTGPSITSVAPNSGLQNQTVSVTITGLNTNFVQGITLARFGPSVMVGSGIAGDFGPVTVTSATTATAQITILSSALPGLRDVTVQTGTEVATLANGFLVVGQPAIVAVTPSYAQQGQTISVALTGAFTNFVQGTTQANFGAGISVGGGPEGGFGPVTVSYAGSATAQITIDPAATLGPRTVIAQTGTEQASMTNGFSVMGPIIGPPPTVTITSPTEATEVTAPTTVTGTVSSPNLDTWTLDYEPAGASTFTTFATGTSSTVSGQFDPTLLLNGNVTLRLTAIDTSGQTGSTTVTVVVARNLKVGNFTLSFNDLSVPVAGLPIQVVRTYDSRNKTTGDFGVGWTLDLKNVTVSENVALGSQWTETSSGGSFPTYCVQMTQTHVVTVTMSDGTTYEFQPVPSPQCQSLVPIQDQPVTVTFAPTGSNTPPNAVLVVAGGTQPLVTGAVPGAVTLVDPNTLATFDPDQYDLTLPDGRVLLISRQFGLQTMTDLNGNSLTVSSSGITSSTGKSVTFTRDTQNRITQITDPSGNVLNYDYDVSGDLVTFTDPLNNVSTYSYDTNHDLLTIVDPAGAQPIRNDYDATGRLVSHTDAYGNVINYTNDPNTMQETVTDRLGNVTVNEYDSDGNIVKVTDALGGVTTRTYDGQGNVLTETNPLSETRTYTYDSNNNRLTETDPLGHTTTYTYNGRNQVLTTTDALGHVTTNTYDANGNLLSTKDAAGNTMTYTYNTAGQQTSITDPLGGVTSFQYDGSGNLTQKTDALGNVTTYTYDANGNKLSETRTRTTSSGQQTLVTSYQYDGLNRLTQTTYPDGSNTQVQYNSIGKQSLTIDQLSRQTSYLYDLMGRLTQTTYPDKTTESSTYDAEGDRITSVDQAGRTTTYTYDPLKRLTETAFPDSSSTSTMYDSAGEVISVTDGRGNETQYQYDVAGRRTNVTDALSHVTSFAYDVVGNQTSMTDANGNATQYAYDSLNRRTQVTYPDSTTDLTGYDALGRTTSKTDQAGQTTQFQYDKLRRLTQVTDALGQITKYGYDEVGERVSQTDANGHITTFAYDQLGRRTQRTLPVGMSETYSYDLAGNLTSKIDFNAKTTTYTYDKLNRLLTKTPDPSFGAPTVSFAYTTTGQRQLMTDASGSTTYSYDLRDRLTQKAAPAGTLTYAYDGAGNLISIQSSNAGGTSVSYSYDQLNRLTTVTDTHTGSTTYTYDNVGNLQGYLYPTGAQTTLSYNTLNRLTNLTITNNKAQSLASYAYTLGPAGNRTAVSELSGRVVNYTYDALYRLTNESISGDPNKNNGAVGYQYDAAGNRLQRTSSLAAVPTATYSYDANDRLTSDNYDSNGNTTASGGNTYAYDFENHLTSSNGASVTVVYDGDGNRVSKTASGVTTQYLVDDRNLTGYAQVLEELSGGVVQRVYTYGLNRISQSQASGNSFYGYDGHWNVRLLADTTGTVTDRYDYDAFGNVISQVGTTPNVYLYSGEQNDVNLSSYYLRSRYLSPSSGRFWTVDTDDFDEDNQQFPIALNKYLYVDANPANMTDPAGTQGIEDIGLALLAVDVIDIFSTIQEPKAGTVLQASQASDVAINISRKTTTALTTMGTLSVAVGGQNKFDGFSLEPSGTNGANRLNLGSYPASVYSSPHFGFNVLLLSNTAPMTDVEIHPGNTWQDTKGCILPGTVQYLNYVGNSRLAFNTIMNLVTNAQQVNASKGKPTAITVNIQ